MKWIENENKRERERERERERSRIKTIGNLVHNVFWPLKDAL